MLRTPSNCHIICYLSVDMLHVKGTHYLNCLIALCVDTPCNISTFAKSEAPALPVSLRKLMHECLWAYMGTYRLFPYVLRVFGHEIEEFPNLPRSYHITMSQYCPSIWFLAHLCSLNQQFYSLNTDLMPVCTVSFQLYHSGNAVNTLPRVLFYRTT